MPIVHADPRTAAAAGAGRPGGAQRRQHPDHRRRGTGKELLARYVHATQPARRTRRFVSVNCAAIPEDLLEMRAVRP